MPKEKSEKKVVKLRHEPLRNQIEKKNGKLKTPKRSKNVNSHNDEEDGGVEEDGLDEERIKKLSKQMSKRECNENEWVSLNDNDETYEDLNQNDDNEDDSNLDGQDEEPDEEYEEEDIVELDGDNFAASGLTESEEQVVQRFLKANKSETKTLADIIMEKIRQNSENMNETASQSAANISQSSSSSIPPKVAEVYTSVGKILHHYKSGKLPKALKMLPHLKNWEDILWLTRPDEWSPCATYACTRIFASNLNAKMAQRFYNLVLLEKCRDDIQENRSLNYHLYMALKKSLFKPAAFYKGVLLPLVQSHTCTLREATIFGSVLMKVSIPGNHSAAVLLRLAEMPYNGSNSLFIKILILKKYALPQRVIQALVNHFISFENDTRLLPVIWHQSLLAFAQRYKNNIDDNQRNRFKSLLKIHSHHQITAEVRRELFSSTNTSTTLSMRTSNNNNNNSSSSNNSQNKNTTASMGGVTMEE